MRKKVIAAAVSLAASAPAFAQSGVVLSGLVDAWAGQLKTAGKNAFVVNSGGMSTSYIGVKGGEDLGGGYRAHFALEGFLQVDSGDVGRFPGDKPWARDAFAGVEGPYGDVRMGRNTTPYFLSTIIFNPFGDSFTFSPMVAHTFLGAAQVQGDTGFDNSIRMRTASWEGLYGDFIYSAGKERDTSPRGTGRAYNLSGFYFRGPVAATLVYQDLNLDTTAASNSQNAWQAGASYEFKYLKLFGQYQESRLKMAGNTDQKTKTWQIGTSVPLGTGYLLASYAQTDNDGNTSVTGTKRESWALGYDYPLSKRTDVYGAYYDDHVKSPDVRNGAIGVGVRHKF